MLYGKDFVNTHSKEFAKVLQTEVQKLLKSNETLLYFTYSNNKNSYYITLLDIDLHRWITFWYVNKNLDRIHKFIRGWRLII